MVSVTKICSGGLHSCQCGDVTGGCRCEYLILEFRFILVILLSSMSHNILIDNSNAIVERVLQISLISHISYWFAGWLFFECYS